MTAKTPLPGSYYVESRKTKRGAEIEIEDFDPSRLERFATMLKAEGWIPCKGCQPLLFSGLLAMRFVKSVKNPFAEIGRATEMLRNSTA